MPSYHRLFAWLFLLLSAALLYGLFRPTPPEQVFAHSDKVGHVVIFSAVSLSGRLARIPIPAWLYWPLWSGLAMGLEYVQGAVRPLRIFSIEDAYANLFGETPGLLSWLVSSGFIYSVTMQKENGRVPQLLLLKGSWNRGVIRGDCQVYLHTGAIPGN